LLDDLTLVERCRHGDDLAWEALVRRHQSRVFGLALHYLRDPEEARDAAQEAFVRIFERIDGFRGGGFVPWMVRLVRNHCIDRIRRLQARPPGHDVVEGEDVTLRSAHPDPEAVTAEGQRRALVYRALDRMSALNREMILLKEIQGLKQREIAEMLSIPIGTVKARSNRARLELAREILALDPAYGD
jgi:RNA polymerase sigma-70 factor (ECF subfamily)